MDSSSLSWLPVSVHLLLSSRGRCPDFRLPWALLHTPPYPARCVSCLVLLRVFFLSPLLLSLRSLCHIFMLTCITYICPITLSSGGSPCLQLLPPPLCPTLQLWPAPNFQCLPAASWPKLSLSAAVTTQPVFLSCLGGSLTGTFCSSQMV